MHVVVIYTAVMKMYVLQPTEGEATEIIRSDVDVRSVWDGISAFKAERNVLSTVMYPK